MKPKIKLLFYESLFKFLKPATALSRGAEQTDYAALRLTIQVYHSIVHCNYKSLHNFMFMQLSCPAFNEFS